MSNDSKVDRFRGRVRTLRGPSEDGLDLGVEMRDEAQDDRNRDAASHAAFMKDRQKVRFTKALEDLMARTASSGIGVTNVKTMTISDDDMLALMSHPEAWKEEGFKPLSQYQDQIISKRKDGTIRVLRRLYPGEVGIIERGSEVIYLVMEEGEEPGVQVGVTVVDHEKAAGNV